jgi:zinc finger protein
MYIDDQSAYIHRHEPSPDPLLSLRFYERTSEEQAALGFLAEPTKEPGESSHDASTVEANSGGQRMPHGSVGAVAGRRAIAQGNSDEISAALCRYSAPEEVCLFSCLTTILSPTKVIYFL